MNADELLNAQAPPDEMIRYTVTVSYEAEVTATVHGAADLTREQLREMVLQLCDEGEAAFQTVASETRVTYGEGWPVPLHLLEIRMRTPL